MRKYSFIIPALLLGAILGIKFQHLLYDGQVYENSEKYHKILNTSFNNYVDEIDPGKLTESALKGMAEELDVHSVYIDADEMRSVKEDFQGSFDGIGIRYTLLRDTIVVISTVKAGPAETAGLLSGDKIVNVDGQSAIGLKMDSIQSKIKGEKGSLVELEIARRYNDSMLVFKLKRGKIPFNSVDASYIVKDSIGLIQVNRFSATTHEELRKALEKLVNQGMKNLVLDLRNNPGGLLREAVYSADEFLEDGQVIVYTKGRTGNGFDDIYRASPTGDYKEIPMIVLINESTASAGEILSGAIQDLDRGLIVGTTSFGKGLVQRQYEFGDGSAFRLTISRYHTASERCIQRPFKNKVAYRHFAGRLELKDGSYIENSVEKLKANLLNEEISQGFIDSLPVFTTKNGRKVFGSGGITPDYIVEQDTVTPLSIAIRKKNLILDYITNVLDFRTIQKEYKEDIPRFIKEYEISMSMISDFRVLAVSQGVEGFEELFNADRAYLLNRLKAEIARKLGGYKAFIKVIGKRDKQLLKALDLFPDAVRIMRSE